MTPFEDALNFTMRYEVGPHWNPKDPEVQLGLCDTKERRHKTGYVNDPIDPGGETKFGIAKNSNDIDIAALTWAEATRIYRAKYWLPGRCADMPGRIAFAHFDACVNHGPKKAAQLLQKALSVEADGIIGRNTLQALNEQMAKKDVLKAMVAQRRKFFEDIVKTKPAMERFKKGWLNRIEDLLRSLA